MSVQAGSQASMHPWPVFEQVAVHERTSLPPATRMISSRRLQVDVSVVE